MPHCGPRATRYGLWPSVELLAALALAFIILVMGQEIGASLSVGLLIAFALYIERLFEPIRDLTGEFATHPVASGG